MTYGRPRCKIRVIVQRAGRKATIVLISHEDPPCIRALVIAVVTSSGFIVSFLASNAFSLDIFKFDVIPFLKGGGRARGYFDPFEDTEMLLSRSAFRCLWTSSRSQGIDGGHKPHNGEQADRNVSDDNRPLLIGVSDQARAKGKTPLRSQHVRHKVEERPDCQQNGRDPESAQVVVGIAHQFYQQDAKDCCCC